MKKLTMKLTYIDGDKVRVETKATADTTTEDVFQMAAYLLFNLKDQMGGEEFYPPFMDVLRELMPAKGVHMR